MVKWEEPAKVIINGIALVLIPIVLACISNTFADSLKEREIQGRFVELSVEILKEEPTPQRKGIRNWAIEIINKYSGVPFSDTAVEQLIENIPITSAS